MSNEDLALQIQGGHTSLIPVLWEQIERLIRWKAVRVSRAVHPDNIFSAKDLEEDLYQSGYIAFVESLKTYSAEREGHFSTWLMYHLQTEFAEVTGLRTERQRRDPARWALSLDAPVTGDDGSETEMGSLIPDPSAEKQIESAEDRIFLEELRCTMARILSTIPEDQQEIIHLRYFEGLSNQEAAEAKGTERDNIRNIESRAIRNLREPKRVKFLRPFIDYNFFCGTGLGSFKSTGMSVEEQYLIRQERRRS